MEAICTCLAFVVWGKIKIVFGHRRVSKLHPAVTVGKPGNIIQGVH